MAETQRKKHGIPGARFSHALVAALQGRERVAGLVVEQERVRFAEFRKVSGKDAQGRGRVLIEEGAAFLQKGTIRDGMLEHPDALTAAFKELMRHGSPKPLSVMHVILAVPLARIVGKTVRIPSSVHPDEVESALRLEAERMLPFPESDAYLDWQEFTGKISESGAGDRVFLVVAARKNEVDPYLHAAEAAGLGVVAVEPLTLSIARGLEQRRGITYIALFHSDALLAAALDAHGNARFFHHRSIAMPFDGIASLSEAQERARVIAAELTSFIRFARAEIGDEEQELIVDGVFDEELLAEVRALGASLGIAVRIEQMTHGLSRAAARGAALRGMLPRGEDRLVSLMAVGTEEAYAKRQSAFFVNIALRLIVGAALISTVLFASALVLMEFVERSVRHEAAAQAVLPQGFSGSFCALGEGAKLSEEARKTFCDIEKLNAAILRAVALMNVVEIPPSLFADFHSSAVDGIRIDRVTANVGAETILVDVATQAATVDALIAEREILLKRFTDNIDEIPTQLILTKAEQIPFVFHFVLRTPYQSYGQ